MDDERAGDPLKWYRWAAIIAIASAAANILGLSLFFCNFPFAFSKPQFEIIAVLGVFTIIGTVLGFIAASKKLYQWWLIFALTVNIHVLMLLLCGIFLWFANFPSSSV
jgi:hypothetical protein